MINHKDIKSDSVRLAEKIVSGVNDCEIPVRHDKPLYDCDIIIQVSPALYKNVVKNEQKYIVEINKNLDGKQVKKISTLRSGFLYLMIYLQ